MSIKTILSVVGMNQVDADLKAAVDLCTEAGAHLSVLVVVMAAPPPVGDYVEVVSPSWVVEREEDVEKLDAAVKHAREVLANSGVSFDVDGIYTEFAWADNDIAERALYTDLMFIGASVLGDEDLRQQALSGGLFQSMRPLLIAPDGSHPTLRPKTILFAWDSRPESARAARDAAEMMAAAESVHITLVDPQASPRKNGEEPGADMAIYLARHGANVTVDRLPSTGLAVADVLKQHATDISADLIVMGGYSHSRMRERIFGGVTKSMLNETAIPVLMAR